MASSPAAIDSSQNAEPPFNGWKGLPNVFACIAGVGAFFVFLGGLVAAADATDGNGPAVLLMMWAGGWLGCLFLYATGAVIATLRAINHNLYVIGQQREPQTR